MLEDGGELRDAPPILMAICDLDFELEAGYTITRDDVTQIEFLAHRILVEERAKLREMHQRHETFHQKNAVESKPVTF